MLVKQVSDGNFSIAQQVGAVEYNFPFYARGDSVSFEGVITYRQDQATYAPLPVMSTKSLAPYGQPPTLCYLVEEGQIKNIGNGLLEFKRTYASVPVTRQEGSSIVWSYQAYQVTVAYVGDDNPSQYRIGEIPLTKNATVVYDYSTTKQTSVLAPKIAVLFGQFIYSFGGWTTYTPGTAILAQDSTVDIYKGLIYVQKSIYITAPAFVSTPP